MHTIFIVRIPIGLTIAKSDYVMKLRTASKKKNIYLTTDLTNNPLYKSPLKVRSDSIKNQHSKQEAFQFDFHSLINKN